MPAVCLEYMAVHWVVSQGVGCACCRCPIHKI